MAKIAKPKGTKGQPAEEASQTLSQNGELIGLNFKIEPVRFEKASKMGSSGEKLRCGLSCYMCYLFPPQPTTKKGKFKRKIVQ